MPGLVAGVLEQPDRIGKVLARRVRLAQVPVEAAEAQMQPCEPARLSLRSQALDGCLVRFGRLLCISLKAVKISQVG